MGRGGRNLGFEDGDAKPAPLIRLHKAADPKQVQGIATISISAAVHQPASKKSSPSFSDTQVYLDRAMPGERSV